MIISKKFEFEAAHKLPPAEIYGACSQLHGHTYKLIIELDGEINPDGWIMNFKTMKQIIKSNIIDVLDHSCLNNIIEVPTAENTILWIQSKLAGELPDNIKLKSITLYETSDSYAKIEN